MSFINNKSMDEITCFQKLQRIVKLLLNQWLGEIIERNMPWLLYSACVL